MFIWNDMNEPSVFNGPEITMHKDAKHHGGVSTACFLFSPICYWYTFFFTQFSSVFLFVFLSSSTPIILSLLVFYLSNSASYSNISFSSDILSHHFTHSFHEQAGSIAMSITSTVPFSTGQLPRVSCVALGD